MQPTQQALYEQHGLAMQSGAYFTDSAARTLHNHVRGLDK